VGTLYCATQPPLIGGYNQATDNNRQYPLVTAGICGARYAVICVIVRIHRQLTQSGRSRSLLQLADRVLQSLIQGLVIVLGAEILDLRLRLAELRLRELHD
jgi:hypothetical protein